MAIVTFNNDNVGSSCNLTVTLNSGQTVNVGTVNFPYYFNPTDHNLGPNDVEGNYSFDCGSCVYEFIVTAGDVTTTTTPTPTTTTTTTEEDITTTTTPTPTTTTTTTEEDITTTTTPTPTTTTTTTLPLLECKDITITIPGGLEGSSIDLNTINATKGNENFTVTGVSPNMIQAGSYNYSVTIEVPSTYSNEGLLTCSGIEVIGLTTTTTSTTTQTPCVEYELANRYREGGDTMTASYIDCDGVEQQAIILADSEGVICALQGSVSSSDNNMLVTEYGVCDPSGSPVETTTTTTESQITTTTTTDRGQGGGSSSN